MYELAHERAQATGTSMTGAFEVALEEMLQRVRQRKQADQDKQFADLMSLFNDMADRYGPSSDGDPTAFRQSDQPAVCGRLAVDQRIGLPVVPRR